ncbi:type II toxin-antitoxin system PemK/MazF family toxin [Endozoicomonas sp. 8E]|uniref:type II toxin-antitoxin system PemK/MazF family toxin n=1 Tax=Endozoicomonas sp. 8E TaxID=3035692 RepID=UPI0029391063|nr:type II toxin-antitoxin system PemK/MazF family toxin [Endozoicomonas sp. 8E]WOG26653.1 type II toxin-antitoxin system PemK/MazF family toxin [Endozoicomonas sp. 8E]
MPYIPDRGDVVWINFDPSSGREIRKRRPGLVLSNKLYSRFTKYALVAPITSTIRGWPFEVKIDGGDVSGVALCEQIKSLDYISRELEFIEKADPDAVEEAIAKIVAIFD